MLHIQSVHTLQFNLPVYMHTQLGTNCILTPFLKVPRPSAHHVPWLALISRCTTGYNIEMCISQYKILYHFMIQFFIMIYDVARSYIAHLY